MVNITKWVLLGGGLMLLGLFTKEAAQTSLTGTLSRTGMAGGSIGSALSSVGSGVGDVFRGLLTPLWEVGNFAKSFGFGSPNVSGQGYSTSDPQSNQERIFLTGQGGGFDDAEQQGGGDTGVNTDPIGDNPSWFNFAPEAFAYPGYKKPASGIFDVGGSDIKMSTVFGQNLPLSREARNYYANIGVSTSGNTISEPTGGGSNNTTGGGGGIGGSFGSTPSTSIGSGSFGSKPASGGWGL
jgi:hypothetical protein